ncbi:MAG: LuxR C-terminal-related transcriptional regulator [Alphaproteobacteria bacterium]|jgi:DNA-binding CsgD family transcriptional regulator|nr:LuxR C-terminal-related transcriptional regulator [Alphaproteobacteria bacterium]
MIDITKYPYFNYDETIERLLAPMNSQADLKFVNFDRIFTDRRKFLIIPNSDQAFDSQVDYYSLGQYQHGFFERNPNLYESGYHMWDSLPFDPNGIFEFAENYHNLAHGLSILKQYDTHIDVFGFATTPGNKQINNFYLNKKDLFEDFVGNFYNEMENSLNELSEHTFYCPENSSCASNPLERLSTRQHDCAVLLVNGYSSKEIARQLRISPRTVEGYISVLKAKLQAKNRLQLIRKLPAHF